MVFTLVENLSYVTDVPKLIDIECNDPRSMQAFMAELEDINIYDKLEHVKKQTFTKENSDLIKINTRNLIG